MFSGDQFLWQWLANLARLKQELPAAARLHPGHGEPAGLEMLDRQEADIRTFLDAVRAGGTNDEVIAAMTDFLPSDDLRFLMELSIGPVRASA